MFGGYGNAATAGDTNVLSDMWRFDPASALWTWMGGPSSGGNPGVCGTLGVESTANIPGARWIDSVWTDHSGNFWLFGGVGADCLRSDNSYDIGGDLNDLWKYNIGTAATSGAATVALHISVPAFVVPIGHTLALTVSATDGNGKSIATPTGLQWASLNTSVATVAGGVVTGVAGGTTTISVTDPASSASTAVSIVVNSALSGTYAANFPVNETLARSMAVHGIA